MPKMLKYFWKFCLYCWKNLFRKTIFFLCYQMEKYVNNSLNHGGFFMHVKCSLDLPMASRADSMRFLLKPKAVEHRKVKLFAFKCFLHYIKGIAEFGLSNQEDTYNQILLLWWRSFLVFLWYFSWKCYYFISQKYCGITEYWQ